MNTNDTHLDHNNLLRWNSNNALVPVDCLAAVAPIGYTNLLRHADAVKAENAAFVDEYRRTVKYSREQKAEIIRELGPNAVNIVTGKRIAAY